VLPILRERATKLPRSSRKIAEYLLEHPADVIYLSITEFADRVGVGEATVSRFCQRLGFRGFQQLKLVLAQELVPGALTPMELHEDGPLLGLMRHVAWRSVKVVEDTARLLDRAELERAVSSLSQASKIDFYGVGASGLTALDAQYRFIRIGKICNAYTDAHVQAMSAALLGPGGVAMAFSHSGGTRDVVLALERANESGATTICVTSQARSPITRTAAITLLAASGETTLISTLHSKIAHLFVLELLVDACAQQLGESSQDAVQRSTEAVMDRMY
jgi:DNA-binding MurR/RpiR family transcriptional regulator